MSSSTKSLDRPPNERRTLSATAPFSNRMSMGSDETGESSKSGSFTHGDASSHEAYDGVAEYAKPVRESRWHRSHKSKASGGFLLSNALFESADPPQEAPQPQTQTQTQRLGKGKGTAGNAYGNGNKRLNDGPLGGNTDGGTGSGSLGTRAMADRVDSMDYAPRPSFDVDPTQIVNLALNLSESRRNASRRVISTPIPSIPRGVGESAVGGSLRQHLQAQRRVSRNISPKADRGDRTSASARIGTSSKLNSPMQAVFNSQDQEYEYHFSASTLARAERAKNAIELMAQYRRLLLFVPPLKPQLLERPMTASPAGSIHDSPTASKFPPRAASDSGRGLGRQYNPLQYIRNRKVRLRTSRAIDGETQGFGDVDKVSSWVDKVAQESGQEANQTADCLILPPFSKAAEEAASPHASPQSSIGKSQAAPFKIRRPRVDWIINPADLLADVYWLEQDGNKKLIEDREGRKIFPASAELKRPMSRQSEEPEIKPMSAVLSTASDLDLRIETQLPEFKSVKAESETFSDSAASKARTKLREVRDAAHIPHHRHKPSREHRGLFRSRSRSNSDSSDSGGGRRLRQKRSGTAESRDRGKDILEKQMAEMLAKEARDSDSSGKRDVQGQGQRIVESIERQKPALREDLEKARNASGGGHSRAGSIVANRNRNSARSAATGGSSGRASLEVPGSNPRRSLDGLDTTAPNSPQTKATKLMSSFIPSIGMDLSSSRNRHDSPSRRPLSRVRSKMSSLGDRNSNVRNLSRGRPADEDIQLSKVPTLEETEDKRRRSISPFKRTTEDNIRPIRKSGSLRRGREEESGIRGLFKSARNPVSRVSDLLWKKQSSSSPAAVVTSGFSTDESDIEDIRGPKGEKGSRESSTNIPNSNLEETSPSQKDPSHQSQSQQRETPPLPSYLSEMPTFTSPLENRNNGPGQQNRGRPMQARDESSLDLGSLTQTQQQRQAREERRRKSRAGLLDPAPRIDIQNASPSSSPDLPPYNRDSSISDIESRRNSLINSNPLPSLRRNANTLPITGLTNLETSHRPNLGPRQWSISDRDVSATRGPMTKREIARVRALLLCSGIKANEIARRANELIDLKLNPDPAYLDIASLSKEDLRLIPRSQEHRLAAKILTDDIQLSSRHWQSSADLFINTTILLLTQKITTLQSRLTTDLTPRARKTGEEADEINRELVRERVLGVKREGERMDRMLRRRRRRFRWVRRAGWVVVEWGLVGIMWWVWGLVMLVRLVVGVGKGVWGVGRWLLWL